MCVCVGVCVFGSGGGGCVGHVVGNRLLNALLVFYMQMRACLSMPVYVNKLFDMQIRVTQASRS